MILINEYLNFIHRFFMIERHHLLIVKAVYETGTLTEAADRLCLTQSALSHSIKKLEYFLKTNIWVKNGRKIYLTPAGNYVLGLAQRLLPQFEHTELMVSHIAKGQKGILRIGMECHPCYQWLLKIVSPYLKLWPDIDLDVIQKFQFGGLGALLNYDIDLLVTPDPFYQKNINFTPVFDYEQILIVSDHHPLAQNDCIYPQDLIHETLITYPVDIQRLDIYTRFFLPQQCLPKKHKTIETTDIMIQMVAAGRGVAALPKWLALEYAQKMPIKTIKLGNDGIDKKIYLGIRQADVQLSYVQSFVKIAQEINVSYDLSV
jgi:LysR family transcriptional regulator, regulator for metE and metH